MKFFTAFAHAVVLTIAAKCASWIGINYIVGATPCLCLSSVWALFSASSMIKPLIGAFGGFFASFVSCVFALLLSIITRSTISWEIFALHIPGLCAALYWTNDFAKISQFIRTIMPLVCMALFIAHPVGSQAFVYCLWWCVPVIYSFHSCDSLFLKALGSTSVAHAVGSVMWIYLVNGMTPAAWMALIPISLAERFIFACGMVCVYHMYSGCVKIVSIVTSSLFVKRELVA